MMIVDTVLRDRAAAGKPVRFALCGAGFHHYASLCIAAYGYLIKERLELSPSGKGRPGPKNVALPKAYIPRGSPRKTREAHPKLHRHHTRPYRHPLGSDLAAMSMLYAASRRQCRFMGASKSCG